MRLSRNPSAVAPPDPALIAKLVENFRVSYGTFSRIASVIQDSMRPVNQFAQYLRQVQRGQAELLRSQAVVKSLLEGQQRAWKFLESFGLHPGLNPIVKKMGRSKGVFQGTGVAKDVTFIPDAVLYYGFGHFPSDDDPEGQQVAGLPKAPFSLWQFLGRHLITLRPEEDYKRGGSPYEDALFLEAKKIYEEAGKKGVDPGIVLSILLLSLGAEKLFFQIDPEKPLRPQFRCVESWLNRARREIHKEAVKKAHTRQEAVRDTLIFTLRHSQGLPTMEIARRVFTREFDNSTAEALHSRVRTSLSRKEAVLKAAGIDVGPQVKNVTRKRSNR